MYSMYSFFNFFNKYNISDIADNKFGWIITFIVMLKISDFELVLLIFKCIFSFVNV